MVVVPSNYPLLAKEQNLFHEVSKLAELRKDKQSFSSSGSQLSTK